MLSVTVFCVRYCRLINHINNNLYGHYYRTLARVLFYMHSVGSIAFENSWCVLLCKTFKQLGEDLQYILTRKNFFCDKQAWSCYYGKQTIRKNRKYSTSAILVFCDDNENGAIKRTILERK